MEGLFFQTAPRYSNIAAKNSRKVALNILSESTRTVRWETTFKTSGSFFLMGLKMLNKIRRKMADGKLDGNSLRLCIVQTNGRYGVYAAESIAAGQIFMRIEGEQRDRPSRFSIQVGWNLHIEVNGNLNLEELMDRFPWRFLNHSCDGNSMVQGNYLVAVRLIRPGEEVTFNYNATEYEMACPFTCYCSSPFCVGEIRGFKYLAPTKRERLRPLLNLYLQGCPDMSQITVGDPVLP